MAAEAAKSLNALLGRGPVSAGGARSPSADRDIAIEAMVENNALLVDAMPGDYEVVKKLIEQLDIMPQQVHISVLIAEHNQSDGLNLGVEMAAAELEDNGNDRLLVRGPPPWHRCHTHGGTALRLPHRKTHTPLTAPRQAVESRMGALEAQLSMSMDDINSKLEALIAASS